MSRPSSQESSPARRGRGTARGGGGGGHNPARLFDRYIAVDWSGANSPAWGKNSIWIAECRAADGDLSRRPSLNPGTRSEAMRIVTDRLSEARSIGERVLIGFDFAFGYPRGATGLVAGGHRWSDLWEMLASLIVDDDRNRSNNYSLADSINARLPSPGARFWGRPAKLDHAHLLATKAGAVFENVPERRLVERRARGTKAIWQLHYNGSVGSQALLGIPRLAALRRSKQFAKDIAIWPFETDFEAALAPITVAEIYPSLFRTDPAVEPRDRAQVEAVAAGFASRDLDGALVSLLRAPADLSSADRQIVLAEEGWIAGVGHDLASLPLERAA